MVCDGHRHLGGSEARTLPECSIPSRKKLSGAAEATPQLSAGADTARQAPESDEVGKKRGGLRGAIGRVLRKGGKPEEQRREPPRQEGEVVDYPAPETRGHTGKGEEIFVPAATPTTVRAEVTSPSQIEAPKPVPLTDRQKKNLISVIDLAVFEEMRGEGGQRDDGEIIVAAEREVLNIADLDGNNLTPQDRNWLSDRIIEAILAEKEKILSEDKKRQISSCLSGLIIAALLERERELTQAELDEIIKQTKTLFRLQSLNEDDELWLEEEVQRLTEESIKEGVLKKEEQPEAVVVTKPEPEPEPEHREPPRQTPQPQRPPEPPRQAPSQRRPEPQRSPEPRREPPRPTPSQRRPEPPRPTTAQPAPPRQTEVVTTAPTEASRQVYFERLRADLQQGQERREAREAARAPQQPRQPERSSNPIVQTLQRLKSEERQYSGGQRQQKERRRQWQKQEVISLARQLGVWLEAKDPQGQKIELKNLLMGRLGRDEFMDNAPDFLKS